MNGSGGGIRQGAAAGAIGALAMTLALGILRVVAGTSWPPELVGDRIAPLLQIALFNKLLELVGGYNELKQIGLGGTIIGQLVGGIALGAAYGRAARSNQGRADVLLAAACGAVWLASIALLWPVLDTSYRGLPRGPALLSNAAALLVAYALYGLVVRAVLKSGRQDREMVAISALKLPRRTVLLAGVGGALAVTTVGLVGWLYRGATFAYDGLRYSGPDVQPITPNDRFYTVTKNVIDPRVHAPLWRLEVSGMVGQPGTYTLDELRQLPAVTQETTLMCISNSVGDGLMSNARWTGVPLRTLIERSIPRSGVVEVLCRSVDNYSDTLSLERALAGEALLAYEMNGESLPERHGFPVRLVVPGLFGEKSVKWITSIELVDHDAKGFYESQGWGPNFVVPTHSRIDAPNLSEPLAAGRPVTLRGIAFAGDRGVRSVEISVDDGSTWNSGRLEYAGSKLSWAIWTYDWIPARAGEYRLVVRATDRSGLLQTKDERGTIPEGSTGYHSVIATVEG